MQTVLIEQWDHINNKINYLGPPELLQGPLNLLLHLFCTTFENEHIITNIVTH